MFDCFYFYDDTNYWLMCNTWHFYLVGLTNVTLRGPEDIKWMRKNTKEGEKEEGEKGERKARVKKKEDEVKKGDEWNKISQELVTIEAR